MLFRRILLSSSSSSSLLLLLGVLLTDRVVVKGFLDLEFILGLIPDEITDAIPMDCQGSINSAFETAVSCAVDNLDECRLLVDMIPEFANIPTADEVNTCQDIKEPFCRFSNACELCDIHFKALVECFVLQSDGIDQETIDLVDECSLSCSSSEAPTIFDNGNSTDFEEDASNSTLSSDDDED